MRYPADPLDAPPDQLAPKFPMDPQETKTLSDCSPRVWVRVLTIAISDDFNTFLR
ncbi:MAG: hypothetical protein K0Q46_6209 [Rhodococcus erythropolis]|jgi:hypothetical protein|nr:hypothetical protein [Rhodococcus erythropolis]